MPIFPYDAGDAYLFLKLIFRKWNTSSKKNHGNRNPRKILDETQAWFMRYLEAYVGT